MAGYNTFANTVTTNPDGGSHEQVYLAANSATLVLTTCLKYIYIDSYVLLGLVWRYGVQIKCI